LIISEDESSMARAKMRVGVVQIVEREKEPRTKRIEVGGLLPAKRIQMAIYASQRRVVIKEMIT
jgi:hypothetical protein